MQKQNKEKYIFHSQEIKDVSPTLTCGGRLTDNGSGYGRTDGFAPILVFEKELNEENKMDEYRIRKMTPRECFRLMGVNDENIDKMCSEEVGLTNNQLYKLAGNSIVVNSIEAVFNSMFINYKDKGHVKPLRSQKEQGLF